MRAVFPGKPQATVQSVCTTKWEGRRIIAYITGTAIAILGGPHDLLQTIYHDEGDPLDAVALDENTGNIAVCSRNTVYIYQPYSGDEGNLKWRLQRILAINEEPGQVCTLSWGTSEELLVGSHFLRLFDSSEDDSLIWERRVSSPVKFAKFSDDASKIASSGYHDRLVKVWRRLSYGSDDVRFDFAYLHHPTTVTGINWRRRHHREQNTDTVLYTICADSKVRIWAAIDPHGLQVLQLWAAIDMLEAIQPRHIEPTNQSRRRYVFMVDSEDFDCAIEQAVKETRRDEKEQHALEHLVEAASGKPDVCVVLDGKGHMSAWGLENIGSKAKDPRHIFNITHVDEFPFQSPSNAPVNGQHIHLLGFLGRQPGSTLTLLVHYFDGSIQWMTSKIDELFGPSPRTARLVSEAIWTGHAGPIKKLVRDPSGKSLLSRTNNNEVLVWKQESHKIGLAMIRISAQDEDEHILRSWLLEDGSFVFNLHHGNVSLWDTRCFVARKVASCIHQLKEKPLCLLQLPKDRSSTGSIHIAAVTLKMNGIVWQVSLPPKYMAQTGSEQIVEPVIRQYCVFAHKMDFGIAFVLPTDPVGSSTIVSGLSDTSAKDIAMSCDLSGTIRTWTAKLDAEAEEVKWQVTAIIETGIRRPSLASASSIWKAALVHSSRNVLTIWDSRGGQLEHEARYQPEDVIQDLDWTSTPDHQSVLAICFPQKVIVLSQMQYDYLNSGPAWATVREVHTAEFTDYPIGDSIWLSNGNLVIGAGNQLFVYDSNVDSMGEMIMSVTVPMHEKSSKDLFDIVTRLNGSLPVFHPQFLWQCFLAGKITIVKKIILGLNKALTYFSDGDSLDSFVGISMDTFCEERTDSSAIAKKELKSSYAGFDEEQEESQSVSELLALSLHENLAKKAIPQLTSHDQIQLASVLEYVAAVEKQHRSLDDNAMRYLLFFRQYILESSAQNERPGMTWRDIAWACHSTSQDILTDLVSKQFAGKMLWTNARESGMFMWMTDITALKMHFETVARNEYTKTDEKNPIDCSLYYVALKKKNVLLGLWRMAAWNREQSSTQKLLSNNFQDSRWKTAALKNAYALMGRRRFQYAASFFLLAGNLKDAVNVCANQMSDLQLAITIARVYEGDQSPALRSLLREKVLSQAIEVGDRWLASWAFWMLGERDTAVRALVVPLPALIDVPGTPSLQAKSFLNADPALVTLYKYLRDRISKASKGVAVVSPAEEWEFVIQNARLYDRMGCGLLALALVRDWEFSERPAQTHNGTDDIQDPSRMMQRRSSVVVDLLSSPKSPKAMDLGAKKVQPKSFDEPDSNSLLDSFGY